MNFQFLVESCVSMFKGQAVTKKIAEAIIRNVFDDISDGMVRGESINVRGFGTFSVTEKKGRAYVEPRTQSTVYVDAKNYPRFSASPVLKDAVKGS